MRRPRAICGSDLSGILSAAEPLRRDGRVLVCGRMRGHFSIEREDSQYRTTTDLGGSALMPRSAGAPSRLASSASAHISPIPRTTAKTRGALNFLSAYESQGIPPGQINCASGHFRQHADGSGRFEDMVIHATGQKKKGFAPRPSISISVPLAINEIRAARRKAALEYHVRYPYTMDYLAPSYLAALPFIGSIISFIRAL